MTGLTDPKPQVSKQFACQLPNDVSQGSNLLDQLSISDNMFLSEFLPDHQSARTNNNHHTSPQNKDPLESQSNESIKPSLLNRIT
ncbi:hypothetical protein PSTG_01248 [Puccinia striiformis f. sp. tritici PST-78]|uniref:Uncharacterized protein n=1 Tax=Puccinia striiformis f. sp. tritici PST-78 TaxID=1165861 RepID=A0A0L0W2F3_9BASI|nr:hypothetical protein PSTG_01248 [Puccinia striiformis f. sp. tritici PST-78]